MNLKFINCAGRSFRRKKTDAILFGFLFHDSEWHEMGWDILLSNVNIEPKKHKHFTCPIFVKMCLCCAACLYFLVDNCNIIKHIYNGGLC